MLNQSRPLQASHPQQPQNDVASEGAAEPPERALKDRRKAAPPDAGSYVAKRDNKSARKPPLLFCLTRLLGKPTTSPRSLCCEPNAGNVPRAQTGPWRSGSPKSSGPPRPRSRRPHGCNDLTIEWHQEALRVDENMPLLAFDLLARIVPMRVVSPPFSALFTLWLSMMAAVGEASRSALSRHST